MVIVHRRDGIEAGEVTEMVIVLKSLVIIAMRKVFLLNLLCTMKSLAHNECKNCRSCRVVRFIPSPFERDSAVVFCYNFFGIKMYNLFQIIS